MEDTLKNIYYQIDDPGSFGGAKRLHYAAKQIDPSITLRKVKKWLSSQFPYTLHRPARRVWKRNQIVVSTVGELYQIDLTFMKDYVGQNDGYRYVLTCIDCFSRRAWAKALKSKKPKEVVQALEKIFEDGVPMNVQSDAGGEFVNFRVKRFFKERGVNFYQSKSPRIKCSMVENFNKYFKNKMHRIFTSLGTRKWYDKIDQVIESYNRAIHRRTGMAPIDINHDNADFVFQKIYGVSSIRDLTIKEAPKVHEGDTVRIQYDKKHFDRGFWPLWAERQYKVANVISDERPYYKIDDDSKRRYYPEEIQQISENLYRVERIIKERGRGPNKKYLVRFLGYGPEHDQWLPSRDLQYLQI